MTIISQIISIMISTFLGYALCFNFLPFTHSIGSPMRPIVLFFSFITSVGAPISLGIYFSVIESTLLASTITATYCYALALIAFFSLQKFADILDRPYVVSENPLFYPTILFFSFVIAIINGWISLGWISLIVLIGIWFVLGFICAESAIRRYMRKSKKHGSKCDRDLAVYAINSASRGRQNMFVKSKRYPFP